MYSRILLTTKTAEEAQLLLGEVRLLEDSLYINDGFELVLAEKLRRSMAALIREEIGGATLSERKKFLEGLRQVILAAQRLELSLADDPSEVFLERISSWVKQNLGAEILLDIHYDPRLVGGAVVSFRGKYADYSVKKRLGEWFNQKKDVNSLLESK